MFKAGVLIVELNDDLCWDNITIICFFTQFMRAVIQTAVATSWLLLR